MLAPVMMPINLLRENLKRAEDMARQYHQEMDRLGRQTMEITGELARNLEFIEQTMAAIAILEGVVVTPPSQEPGEARLFLLGEETR